MAGWKTAIFGVVVALIPVVELVAQTPFVTSHPWAVSAIGVAILALRYVTTTAIFSAK